MSMKKEWRECYAQGNRTIRNDSEKDKLCEIFKYFEEVSVNSNEYLNNISSVMALEILGNEKYIRYS